MRVLQVNKLYYPYIGGVEKVVQAIAEGLKDSVSMRVLACQSFGFSSSEVINGVRVVKAGALTPFWSVPLSFSFPFFFRKLAREADIIHLHFPFPPGELFYLLLIASLNKKLVISWHSDVVRQAKLLPVYGEIIHRILARADRIIVATPKHVQSSKFLPLHKEKCEIIPFGIDVAKYRLNEKETQEVAGIKKKHGRFILFVGRLSYYKGIEYLLRSMVKVEANLIIIGEGRLRKKLEAVAVDLNIQHRVFFLGNLPEDDLKLYFNAGEVFCLPSIYNTEAFGLVQLEAMACAKPVVNTSLPTGASFVSIAGETGLTVPPKDVPALTAALNSLIRDEEQGKLFGANALRRVEKEFSLAKMLSDIQRLYQVVFRSPG